MKQRFIEITSKQIKVYDAQTTTKELIFEIFINFVYALLANIPSVFIILKYDIGIIFSFLGYYLLLSYILNRAKYETNLGKFIISPIAMTCGGFTGIKLGYILFNLL